MMEGHFLKVPRLPPILPKYTSLAVFSVLLKPCLKYPFFSAAPPLCPQPTTCLCQKTPFLSSSTVTVPQAQQIPCSFCCFQQNCKSDRAMAVGTCWEAWYHGTRHMCIENFLKVAVRAQNNWPNVMAVKICNSILPSWHHKPYSLLERLELDVMEGWEFLPNHWEKLNEAPSGTSSSSKRETNSNVSKTSRGRNWPP